MGDETVKRPRGRPRRAEPGSRISTYLPASEHAAIVERAKAHRVTPSRYLRGRLRYALHLLATRQFTLDEDE